MADTTRPPLAGGADAGDRYAGYSPIMRQYLTLKEQHPGVMLLYRLGDFYETFFDDAVKANRVLGLTLTRRGKGTDGSDIPMAGVPAATLEQYLARLVNTGISVAVCEQMSDPVPGRNIERKIVRIVTPGTLTDGALLNDKADSPLAAWVPAKRRNTPGALVWLTLANGDFRACRCAAEDLAGELARLTPGELLLSESVRESLGQTGVLQASGVTVTPLPDWHFDAERGAALVREKFGLEALSARGLENEPEILSGINAVLGYVEQTQCDALPFLRAPVLEENSAYVILDAVARRNLEISQTIRADEGATLMSVVDHCRTSMGSRMLLHWLNHPLRDFAAVRARHEAVEELLGNPDLMSRLDACVNGLPDVERSAARLALRSIRPREIAALRDSLDKLADFAALSGECRSALLESLTAAGRIDSSLAEELHRWIAPEPAALVRDGDVIAAGASEELDSLRAMRDNTGGFLVELEARERERTGLASLRVEYNRVSGYYIEVPRSQSENVPDDYRRRQTLKNVERFITPELKEFEDKALSAKERSLALEKELWEALLTRLQVFVQPLLDAASAVASADALLSFAKHAQTADWVRPTMSTVPGIELKGARHPVVEHALEHYVPNDCILTPSRRLLVITGPNMGGKSTYMRSIALVALLACAGSFVPASSARIGPIDRILTRIGASDDLARGRSTFMVEMTEAAAILHQATPNSLVLMDEIGRGTSTFDGLSLAGAIAKELASASKSYTLFATHYFELTQLAAQIPEVANVHVSARETNRGVVFLHDVKEGPANQSYGIAVAELAGIPSSVTRRARAMLAEIEERTAVKSDQLDLFSVEEPAPAPAAATQKSLASEALTEEIGNLDVDGMSPREALEALYAIKEKARRALEAS